MYTFRQPRPQEFSFKNSIIDYIIKNPTGKAWRKLIKTCKTFFSKFPVFPILNLSINRDEDEIWTADGIPFESQTCCKLWIYRSIYIDIDHQSEYLLKSIIPKIFKCDLLILNIKGQTLTWKEYNFLTSSGSCEYVNLTECEVKYSGRSYVTADKLLENLQNVERFNLYFPENCWSTIQWDSYAVKAFQSDTVKKMVQIFQRHQKLKSVSLECVTEAFDFSSFSDFFSGNKSIYVNISFDSPLSDGYKQMLQNYIDKLVKNRPEKMPSIWFHGFDSVKNAEYKKLCGRY